MYLTYDDYAQLGGTADKDKYKLLEFKTRKHLDLLTDCRIQRMSQVPEAVKLCMVSMIDIEAKAGIEAQISSPQVSSFTTDGYSESYRQQMDVNQVRQAQNDIVRAMLYGELDDEGTPLLYRGLY